MNWDFVFLMVTLSLIYSQLFQNMRWKRKAKICSHEHILSSWYQKHNKLWNFMRSNNYRRTMNSFVQSPGGSWILSLRHFLTNSTFTCVKNSDCAAKRQVRATQCLIQVCVIHWMMCLAPIGCFSLSVIHHPLLLSAPFRVRHSGSCDFVLTYPCFFLHYIHEPPLRPSSFPPPWQLHLHPLCSFLSLLCTCPKHLCLPCLTI